MIGPPGAPKRALGPIPGPALRAIRRQPNLRIIRVVPRYYTEFGFLMRLPIVREFLAWNCAVLIERQG